MKTLTKAEEQVMQVLWQFGKASSQRLISKVQANKYIQLVANPSETEMIHLIQNAQINLVISFNSTGIKLKLINALLYGRHCIVNSAAIEGTGLEPCCIVISKLSGLKDEIVSAFQKPYLISQNRHRMELLTSQFDDNENIKMLIKLLY